MRIDAAPDGSPYVFEEFTPGVIYSTKEKTDYSLELNINAISNRFEFKYQEDIYEMPNFAFDSVFINNSKFSSISELLKVILY